MDGTQDAAAGARAKGAVFMVKNGGCKMKAPWPRDSVPRGGRDPPPEGHTGSAGMKAGPHDRMTA